MRHIHYHKMRQAFYHKMRRLLQNAMILFQNAAVIIKCHVYYKNSIFIHSYTYTT